MDNKLTKGDSIGEGSQYDSESEELVQLETFSYCQKAWNINLDEEVRPPSYYRRAFDILRNAVKTDSIRIIINTEGGYISTVIQFYHYIKQCEAEVTCELHRGISAGGLVALCCDNIELNNHSEMMIHSITDEDNGTLSSISNRTEHRLERARNLYNELYKNFLTKPELKMIYNSDREIWLNRDQIEKRLEKWVPIFKR